MTSLKGLYRLLLMATPANDQLPEAGSSSQQALTLHDCSPARNTRIAVLGGSFDPITDGHLKCACEIVHARKAQEVWIVPCGTRPDKPSLKTPYMHRLIMCHLAVNTTFGSSFPIRVCDIEMAEARSPTARTACSRDGRGRGAAWAERESHPPTLGLETPPSLHPPPSTRPLRLLAPCKLLDHSPALRRSKPSRPTT